MLLIFISLLSVVLIFFLVFVDQNTKHFRHFSYEMKQTQVTNDHKNCLQVASLH